MKSEHITYSTEKNNSEVNNKKSKITTTEGSKNMKNNRGENHKNHTEERNEETEGETPHPDVNSESL